MGKLSSQNSIGPTIRKIRYQRGLTQAMLAARCHRVGWDIGENTISKIEAQIRCITDTEIIFIAKALGVKIQDFFLHLKAY
jgi:transcriptional regulator with XRE-family HTH domain